MSEDLDIRVSCGLWDHPKWMRLDAALGEKGGMALLRLWGWARRHRPGGDLSGLSDRELAAAARWKGQAARLVSVLVEVGWLDGSENGRRIHGWRERQPHASNTTGFKRAQKIKALERWAAAARMPLDEYVRHTHGMTVEEYLAPEGRAPAMPRHGAGQEPGMVPGMMPGNAATMPPPSSPLLYTHPDPDPERARARSAPGPDPSAGAERGYAPTAAAPPVEPRPPSPQAPGAGRSRPDRLPDEPQEAPSGPETAQAAAAHRLELAIGCGFAHALKAVQGLVVAGADLAWIEARIARSTGTTQRPWDWVAGAKQAWADHQERVGAGA